MNSENIKTCSDCLEEHKTVIVPDGDVDKRFCKLCAYNNFGITYEQFDAGLADNGRVDMW